MDFPKSKYPLPQQDYMVVVKCFTYNHGKYIEDTLKGFVIQKTNFPFCALVVDDFSTDDTAQIIRRYEEQYPDIIKGIYLQENYYSQGGIKREKTEIVSPWFERCKYIAMCEGDDYWTDPQKLQRQVDFLETNPDYSMCFHGAEVLNESVYPFSYKSLENREYSSDELFKDWIVPTASMLFKREVFYSLVCDKRILNGDINLVLASANSGRVFGMSDKMSVYRVQSNGLTINRIKQDYLGLQLRYLEHYECLKENYKKVNLKLYRSKIASIYISIAFIYLKKGKLGLSFINFCKSLCHNPFSLFGMLVNRIIR